MSAERLADLEKRVEALEAKQQSSDGITVEQAFSIFNERAMGTKEFRNFLAKKDNVFKEVRDSSVDDEIDENARRMAEAKQQLLEGDGLQIISKDGEVVPQ